MITVNQLLGSIFKPRWKKNVGSEIMTQVASARNVSIMHMPKL